MGYRAEGRATRSASLLAAAALAGACSPSAKLPDLTAIYEQVDAAGALQRRPLITIPGTLGSRLVDTESGRVIWGGGSRGLSADPEDPIEAELIALPLIPPDAPIDAARDTVEAAGILDVARAEVLGIPIDVEVYGGVLRTLSAGGFEAERPGGASRFVAGGDADRTVGTPVGSPAAAESGRSADPVPAAFAPVEATRPELAPGVPRPTVQQYGEIVSDRTNAFRFAYDWRRDLASLAKELDRFIWLRKRRLAAIRSLEEGRNVPPASVTFDMLAHSMGGLLARYYLMYGAADLGEEGALPPLTWAGARHFDRVIIVAAPNAGSVLAMDNLINGKSLGPLQPFYPAAMLATHGSPWQLFPRERHRRLRQERSDGAPLDPLDPELWERNGWGLASAEAAPLLELLLPDEPDADARRERALAHQARLMRRAERFHAALDRPWVPPKPSGLEMFLVAGGGFATPAGAVVDPATGRFEITTTAEGDGVVLRESVLLDERQGDGAGSGLRTPLRFDTTLFLPDEHVELTKNPVFGDNLLFWLLQQPRREEDLAEPQAASLFRGDVGSGEAPFGAGGQGSSGQGAGGAVATAPQPQAALR